jgi:hypothetical protein
MQLSAVMLASDDQTCQDVVHPTNENLVVSLLIIKVDYSQWYSYRMIRPCSNLCFAPTPCPALQQRVLK